MRRRRTLAVLVTAALVATTVAGCRGTTTGAATIEPHYTPVTVPAELGPSSTTVEQVGVLGAAGSAPWSVHAIRTVPGEPPRAVVWTADGGTLPSDPTVLPVDGEAESLVVAGSGVMTVAAVRSRGAQGVTTQVLTSRDRRTWSPVYIPSLRHADGAAAAVDGDEAVIVGTDAQSGELVGVLVTPGGTSQPLQLPRRKKGNSSLVHVAAVAVNAGEITLVVSQERGGDGARVSALRNLDREETWFEEPIEGDHVQIAGIAATSSGYVLTGQVRVTRGDRQLTRAALWTAYVGVSGFFAVADPPTAELDDDTFIGAPAATGESYRVEVGGLNLPNVVVTDEKETLFSSVPLGERGMIGPTAIDEDGTLHLIAAGQHGATVLGLGQNPPGHDKLVEVARLGVTQHWLSPGVQVDSGVVSAIGTRVVDRGTNGWRDQNQQRRYTLDADGSALAEVQADAVVQGAEAYRLDVSGPSGDLALVTGYSGDQGAFRTTPWARTTAGQWQQGEIPGASSFAGPPVWVGGAWLLPGETAAGADADDARTATVWTSSDGLTWTADEGFAGTSGQTADTVCPLGLTDALVLGTDHGSPMVRSRIGGVWQDSPLAVEGRTVHDCFVAKDGSTVLRVSAGNTQRLLATKDGIDVEEVLKLDADSSIGTVHEVPGGFAAVGGVLADGQHASALWVSTDGLIWRHLEGPAGEDSLTELTVLDGTVVVMIGDERGTRVWRLDNLDKVMSAPATTSKL